MVAMIASFLSTSAAVARRFETKPLSAASTARTAAASGTQRGPRSPAASCRSWASWNCSDGVLTRVPA